MRIIATTIFAVLLTSCAATDKASTVPTPTAEDVTATTQTAPESSKESRLVCRLEKTIGSNKKVRSCIKV